MCFFITGQEEWAGICRNGRRQSPIDLAKDAAVMGRYPSLYFRNYDGVLQNAKIRNTGHSCKFSAQSHRPHTIFFFAYGFISIVNGAHRLIRLLNNNSVYKPR